MKKKIDYFYYSSLILAIWFLLTAWIWVYLFNLVLALPAGILSLLLFFIGRRKNPSNPQYKFILYTLGAGLVISSIIFICLLAYN